MGSDHSEQLQPADYVGRLFDLPSVNLRPFRTPITELWKSAPHSLRQRASRPMRPAQKALWDVLRQPEQLGCPVHFNVPIWFPWEEVGTEPGDEVGYVLDFLIPEYGVNVQVDPWDPVFDSEGWPEFDFDAQPDHPYNEEREPILCECRGIETVRYWDQSVDEVGAEEICVELRRELGIGCPAWLKRNSEKYKL